MSPILYTTSKNTSLPKMAIEIDQYNSKMHEWLLHVLSLSPSTTNKKTNKPMQPSADDEFCSFRLFLEGDGGLDRGLCVRTYCCYLGTCLLYMLRWREEFEMQGGWLWRTPVRLILEYLLRLDR